MLGAHSLDIIHLSILALSACEIWFPEESLRIAVESPREKCFFSACRQFNFSKDFFSVDWSRNISFKKKKKSVLTGLLCQSHNEDLMGHLVCFTNLWTERNMSYASKLPASWKDGPPPRKVDIDLSSPGLAVFELEKLLQTGKAILSHADEVWPRLYIGDQ